MDLRGARVVVTGASRGIGADLARGFAGAGASVVLLGRRTSALESIAAETDGDTWPVDLADRTQVGGLVARIVADTGPIDVLVNNAGVEAAGAFLDHDPRDVEALLRLNLLTPMELCRQACPAMVSRRRGHVVNVSSMAAYSALPGLAAYGASKAGLTQFTAGLRADLRGTGVGTTLVELGPVTTGMLDRVKDYPPTGRSFDRLARLKLLADVPPASVADAVVRAVSTGRRHVRLPRRAAIAAVLAGSPRRVTEALLTGIPHQQAEPRSAADPASNVPRA